MLASRSMIAAIVLFVCFSAVCAAAPIKVLLCSGDYGMWAQDRAALIQRVVEKAAPGQVAWEVEQTYNFVKKLEAPGYAERFDVIVCGDVALGQMTEAMQQSIIRFTNGGGGFAYVVVEKSALPFNGSREAEPLSLTTILPYRFPKREPTPDATALPHDDALFKGLDFSNTPLLAGIDESARKNLLPLALERRQGKGLVIALFGAFTASYKYTGYASYEHRPGGWDEWPGLGELWSRLLARAATGSPVRQQSRAEVDARIRDTKLNAKISIDATKAIDDLRAANLSISSLNQLYREDGGNGEEAFLALNPRDWLDRFTDQVLDNNAGKVFPDKRLLYSTYRIKGILHGNSTFGSYGGWKEDDWQKEITRLVQFAGKNGGYLTYMQPSNEPPCDAGYFSFHNRLAGAVLKEVPALKVTGPGAAFNLGGVDEQAMKAFIENCGANTDVLNWHIYARPPENVKREVLHWTKYATGKLRDKGPVRVMFTEADSWNTRESQFNYLLDRAFTFLPMPEIIGTFQYCMRPRYEGGTYWFGVLMHPTPDYAKPAGEFAANYTAYWILRNLRGKMVECTVTGVPAEAAGHVRALASSDENGRKVSIVVYYDTGYFDGPAGVKAGTVQATLTVKLPEGNYRAERDSASWNTMVTTPVDGTVAKQATLDVTLSPAQAAAVTWTRM